MIRELGYVPRFRGAGWADFRALLGISLYVFLIQLSVVLADRLDKTVLGFVLEDAGLATTIYENVSKPFVQIRQTGWMLSYMVMPAVASLARLARGTGSGADQVRRLADAHRPADARGAPGLRVRRRPSCGCGSGRGTRPRRT